MDELEAAELRDLRSLVEHPGWIVFSRDLQRQIDTIERSALDTVKAIEDVAYKKGARDALRVIVGMSNFLDQQGYADAPDDV